MSRQMLTPSGILGKGTHDGWAKTGPKFITKATITGKSKYSTHAHTHVHKDTIIAIKCRLEDNFLIVLCYLTC